jgi:PAS domain S-box-containing protein
MDENFVFTYVSKADQLMRGYHSSEVVGKSLLEILADDSRKEVESAIKNFQETKRLRKMVHEGEYICKNGETITFEVLSNPLYDETGRLTGFQGVSRDITARKKIEKNQERLFKELGKKNDELERFTYTVSHDLKSPLITIKGFADALMLDIEKQDFKRVESDVYWIKDAANTMGRMLEDLLALSRVGRVINQPRIVLLVNILEDAQKMVSGALVSTQASIEYDANLPEVCVDRSRIIEVFQNLFDNAIKYRSLHRSPKVIVEVLHQDNDWVFLRVEDNGIGIDEKQHEHIFGLFTKLDKTTEGSGIGLALVKRIIEKHGGTIRVEHSQHLGGAAFILSLPTSMRIN